MDNGQIKELFGLLKAQNAVLATIAEHLASIAQGSAPESPNYRRCLTDFPAFDWGGIGAEVSARDTDGVTVVNWNHQEWKRRSGAGKYGKAIWFSRPAGKDDNGENQYHRLITFKEYDDAEPLPNGIVPASAVTPPAQPAPPAQPVPPAQPAPPAQPVPAPQPAPAPAMPQHQAIPSAAPAVTPPDEIPQNPSGLLALMQQVAPGEYNSPADIYNALGHWPKVGDAAAWKQAYMTLVGGDDLDHYFPR